MIIRDYRPADLEALARLFTDAVHTLGAAHYTPAQCAAWAPRPPDLEDWKVRLSRLQTLVAETDAGRAGFVSFNPNGRIEYLYTALAQARRGIATALYRHAEAHLIRAGATLLSTEASLVARPIFERQGFKTVEQQQVERRGEALSCWLMHKAFLASAVRKTD